MNLPIYRNTPTAGRRDRPLVQGRAAIHAAAYHDVRLYVLNATRGWVLGSLSLAQRLAANGDRVQHYGVYELPAKERRCIGCWRTP